eukprot:457164_1
MDTSFLKKQTQSSIGYFSAYQLTKFDHAVTIFGFTSFFSGVLITRNARKELQKLGNRYNVNYKVRPNKLASRGIYRYSRHPVYLGVMLMVIGMPLCLHTTMVPLYKKKSENFNKYMYAFWFANTAVALAFFDRIEIPREEAILRDTFGTKYTNYKEKTPKWIGLSYDEKKNTCNAGTNAKNKSEKHL